MVGLAGNVMNCLDNTATSCRTHPMLLPPVPWNRLPDVGTPWQVWWDSSHHQDGKVGIDITLGNVGAPCYFKWLFL